MKQHISQPGIFAAFFGFKRMVSPFFIAIVYFLGLIAIVVLTAMTMLKGPHLTLDKFGLDFESGLLVAVSYACMLLAAIAAVFLWRFCCEMLVVLFGVNQQLLDIKATLEGVEETEGVAQAVTGIESITNEKEQQNSINDAASNSTKTTTKITAETVEQAKTIEPIKEP